MKIKKQTRKLAAGYVLERGTARRRWRGLWFQYYISSSIYSLPIYFIIFSQSDCSFTIASFVWIHSPYSWQNSHLQWLFTAKHLSYKHSTVCHWPGTSCLHIYLHYLHLDSTKLAIFIPTSCHCSWWTEIVPLVTRFCATSFISPLTHLNNTKSKTFLIPTSRHCSDERR